MLLDQSSAFATFPGENGKIAFTSKRDGNAEIYSMNADGSGQINLSNNPSADSTPSWSPDGTEIAFGSYREDNNNKDVYVMNADGSNVRRLTTDSSVDDQPDWSPDGTKIAFVRTINNGEIYVMNSDGSGETRLTNSPYVEGHPDWSPDGTEIAFYSDRANGNGDLYVMNADGSNVRRLITNPDTDHDPSWSPDGTMVAFVTSRHQDGGEIYVINADGTRETNISNNPHADFNVDWGTNISTPPSEEDTTAPVISVPDDMTVEATGPDGATVSFEVSAEDDVDGPVDVTCDYDSGDTFPIGGTVVTCSAEDAAGNSAEETFTITVQDSTDPDVEITQVVDRRNRVLGEGDTTPTPYIRITFEATDAVGVEDIECNLDGQGFTFCTSHVVYDRLSRGTHQVTVRATDEAGNAGDDQFLFTVGSSSAAAAPGRQ